MITTIFMLGRAFVFGCRGFIFILILANGRHLVVLDAITMTVLAPSRSRGTSNNDLQFGMYSSLAQSCCRDGPDVLRPRSIFFGTITALSSYSNQDIGSIRQLRDAAILTSEDNSNNRKFFRREQARPYLRCASISPFRSDAA
jgi:hypothetical protein